MTLRSLVSQVPARTRALVVACAVALTLLAWVLAQWRLPGNDVGYTPVQPIPFSHRLHATELQVACLYCHSGADSGRYAGMPAANVCMNCHRFVSAPSQAVKDEHWRAVREGRAVRRVVSDAMRALYRAQGLDDALQVDPDLTPQPIAWTRVTQFPDFAYFDHGAHSRVAIDCVQCHGEVQRFERTSQAQSLSMGSCVACHRDSNREGVNGMSVQASLDCASCHR